MNPAYLKRMSGKELDAYARQLGIDTTKKKSLAAKMQAIEDDRERTAEVDVLGIQLSVRKSKIRDKRVTDVFNGGAMTDADIEAAMRLLVGDEGWDEVIVACTDEDGSVDVDAMTYATMRIIDADAVKNLRG